jgi:phospholipid/cholesterol/gamma-HCH transport system substrate-binding protein
METRARYALIGLFMLAVIAASFAFVYWLENTGGFLDRASYRIQFSSPVPGLLVGSAVNFNGIRVGEVTALALDPAEPQSVVATIAVERNIPIRSDTEVSVDVQGLTGGALIALRGGSPSAPPLEADDSSLPTLIAAPSAAQDWTQAARDAFQRVDNVLAENSETLHSAITNIDVFAQALARNSDKVDSIVAGIERMTGGSTPKSQLPTYDLTAVKDFPPLTKAPDWQLAVPEPTALMAVNTDKMQTQPTQGETIAIPNAQWADNLPVMLQEKVVQSFENAGYAQAVSRPRDGLHAGFQLLIDIRRFAISTSGAPTAEIEFVAKILSQDGKILAAKAFTATAPADSAEAPAAAAALNQAFAKAVTELVPWTADAVGAAPMPPVTTSPPAGAVPPADAMPPEPTPPT